VARLVRQVGSLLATAVPGPLDAIDVEVAGIGTGLVEADVVEEENSASGPMYDVSPIPV
jgi:hypothetical protein